MKRTNVPDDAPLASFTELVMTNTIVLFTLFSLPLNAL